MQKTQTICLVILTTIAVAFSLYYLQTVLLPFVISLFVVIGMRPILEFIQDKLNLHWFFAFVVTFSTGVALLIGFVCLVWISIYDLRTHSAAYEQRLESIAEWVQKNLQEHDEDQDPELENQDPELDDLNNAPTDSTSDSDNQSSVSENHLAVAKKDNAEGDAISSQATEPDKDEITTEDDEQTKRPSVVAAAAQQAAKPIDELFAKLTTLIRGQMLDLAGSLSNLLSYIVLILIFVFFMLLEDRNRLARRGSSANDTRGIVGEVEEQIRKYLVVKTVISVFTGLVFGFFLWLFGVPLAILFGFLAFILNYIPNFGPLIAIMLPTPFLVLNSDMSPSSAAICFALISTTQFVSGNVVEPRIMGKSFDVSPVFLLLALMFFGLIWGILGMFLATPIVSVIKIVLQGSPSSRVLAEIMAGRWDGKFNDSSPA